MKFEKKIKNFFGPIDAASIGLFRIAFGGLMAFDMFYWLARGWVQADLIDPPFHFTYYGWDWVQPLSGNGMLIHFWVMGIISLLIMVGVGVRLLMPLFFLGFSYIFLIDQSHYLNHFYFIILVSFILSFIPSDRAFSLSNGWKKKQKKKVITTLPAWGLWWLRFQVAVVYFYGGIAKLNTDWLIEGEPMRMWLAGSTHFPLIGSWFTQEWMVYLFSWGGMLFDLLIIPFLLWKRTRLAAFIVAIGFNLTNHFLFNIGIFPWFMLGGTLLFFNPAWPKIIWAKCRRKSAPKRMHTSKSITLTKGRKIGIVLLAIYTLFQLLFPLRHWLVPGYVHWTKEHTNFSWFMRLNQKDSGLGFMVFDMDKKEYWELNPADYITTYQFNRMKISPDMILQFVHHVADELHKKGRKNIQIKAANRQALNGRDPQPFFDHEINLLEKKRTLGHHDWIIPIQTP